MDGQIQYLVVFTILMSSGFSFFMQFKKIMHKKSIIDHKIDNDLFVPETYKRLMLAQPLKFFLWRNSIVVAFLLLIIFSFSHYTIFLKLLFGINIFVAILFAAMVFNPFGLWVNLFVVAFTQLKKPKLTFMKSIFEYTEIYLLGHFKIIPLTFEEKLFTALKNNLHQKIKVIDENLFFIISKSHFSLIKTHTLNKMAKKLRLYLYITLSFLLISNVCIVYYGAVSDSLLFRNGSYNTPTNNMSFTDSIYFVLTIFSTTGFGDISPINDMGKWLVISFYISIIILGTGVITFFSNILQERVDDLTYPMEAFMEELIDTQKEINRDIDSGNLIGKLKYYKKKFSHNPAVAKIIEEISIKQ
jgi:hypothetical protein